jgi:hypothetical protein
MTDAYVAWAERSSATGKVERRLGMTDLGGGRVLRDDEERCMDIIDIKAAIARAEKDAFEAGYGAAQRAMKKALGLA